MIIEQRIHYYSNTHFNHEETDEMVHYLFQIDNWGYYELTLFDKLLFCLNLEQ
ncbi:hypothetical protein HZY86_09340 [Aerococcaceae bacterium DSM 111020]|nr:hypothetical protein [Aerococcaceae bacterium DSM 111020]